MVQCVRKKMIKLPNASYRQNCRSDRFFVKTKGNKVSRLLHSLQYRPKYPSGQPPGHIPLTWSHGILFEQCPKHCALQAIPKYPGGHSTKVYY